MVITRLQSKTRRSCLSKHMDDLHTLALQSASLGCKAYDSARLACPICFVHKRASEMTTLECCYPLVCRDCFLKHCISCVNRNRVNRVKVTCMFCRARYQHPFCRPYYDSLARPVLLLDPTLDVEDFFRNILRRVRAYNRALQRAGILIQETVIARVDMSTCRKRDLSYEWVLDPHALDNVSITRLAETKTRVSFIAGLLQELGIMEPICDFL